MSSPLFFNFLKIIFNKKSHKEEVPHQEGVHQYEYLLHHPRYIPETVILDGREFKIPDSISFYYVYREIFENEIYRFPCNNTKPVILDCGANTGVSVLYFKKLYPECLITAVEADPMIFNILRENLRSSECSNVTLVQGALSAESGKLPFVSEGADGGRLSNNNEGMNEVVMVDCINLDDLIVGPVDFLKMDIEGAEVDVLLNSEKLGSVERMFVEYHSFRNSPQRLDDLLKKISNCGFR